MINLIIDNKNITVPRGTDIFLAAKNNGIYIPGLCYHPKLSQYGGCRLCMVEVTERGRTRHKFSCAQPVSEGMQVKTKTPEIIKYTKSVMEYLLAHHPLDCPTCDKSGECGLQDITHDLKLSKGRFKTVRMNKPMRRDNPLLEFNANRCILCGRCVKLCKDVEGVGAIDFQNRGINTIIGTAFDKPLDCSFCGGCLSVCPTGSWQDRTFKFRARHWELKKTTSICPYCAVGCTIETNTKDNTVLKITSNDARGMNEGNLCIKGRFGHDFVHSDKRIKTPLIKKNGVLSPVSWDDAIGYVAKRFREIKNVYGGKAIGGIGSEKCTNEDNYVFQKFCRMVLETNNIDNLSNMKSPLLNTLIHKSIVHGFTSTTSLKKIEKADTLFFVGADVTEAHPVIGTLARKAIRLNKADLIIANLRNVRFDSIAKNDIRLIHKLGTQAPLINALIKTIIDEKLVDLKRVEKATDGLRELKSLLKTFTIKKASQITGVSEETIRKASALVAKPGNCYIVCGKDIEEDPSGPDTIKALMNLCALINTASSLKTDAGKISLVFSRLNNNSQGANDMGVVPDFFPGYLDIDDQSNRKRFEKSWDTKLSDTIRKGTAFNLIDLALKKKLKAMFVMGENPIVNFPNGKTVKEAFRQLEFIVVQDTFLTETAQLADVVFPTATFAEKEGTYTNMAMEVQRLNIAIPPVCNARQDWQILCDIAKKMGVTLFYESSKEILDEIENTVPIFSGIYYERLIRQSFNWVTAHKLKSRKYKFEILNPKSVTVKKKRDYPFLLLTGPSLHHLGSFSRNSNSLVSVASECFVEVNRKDAQQMNIHDGDEVLIESIQDSMKLKAKVTKKLPENMIFIPEDYEWVHVNVLRDNVYTKVKLSKA
ncbi:MAG: molybdopterin-dependent oxidoreductase [Candidatus Scalindua sp.]|nr:molybdopterin-dependent oxidoreductase [Candidatus Scalindua sp.]